MLTSIIMSLTATLTPAEDISASELFQVNTSTVEVINEDRRRSKRKLIVNEANEDRRRSKRKLIINESNEDRRRSKRKL